MSDEIFSTFQPDAPPITTPDPEPRQKRKQPAKQRKVAPRIGQAPVKRKAAPVKAKGPGRPRGVGRPKGSRNKPKNRPSTDRQSPGRPPKVGFIDGLHIGAGLEADDLKLFIGIRDALSAAKPAQQQRILDALCRATR